MENLRAKVDELVTLVQQPRAGQLQFHYEIIGKLEVVKSQLMKEVTPPFPQQPLEQGVAADPAIQQQHFQQNVVEDPELDALLQRYQQNVEADPQQHVHGQDLALVPTVQPSVVVPPQPAGPRTRSRVFVPWQSSSEELFNRISNPVHWFDCTLTSESSKKEFYIKYELFVKLKNGSPPNSYIASIVFSTGIASMPVTILSRNINIREPYARWGLPGMLNYGGGKKAGISLVWPAVGNYLSHLPANIRVYYHWTEHESRYMLYITIEEDVSGAGTSGGGCGRGGRGRGDRGRGGRGRGDRGRGGRGGRSGV